MFFTVGYSDHSSIIRETAHALIILIWRKKSVCIDYLQYHHKKYILHALSHTEVYVL